MLIGISGAVIVVLLASGGIVAWSKLSGGGPQPADAIPADAIAYARLDLDPSASQKLNAMELLDKWPEFSDETGITDNDVDLRKEFVENALPEDCGIDYADDIEPWIGDRAGLALMPGEDEPEVLITLQVSDQDAAEDATQKLTECTGGFDSSMTNASTPTLDATVGGATNAASAADESASGGTAFTGDYMVIAASQDLADQYAADAEDEPLSSDSDFSADMDALGDEGIASLWFDGAGLADVFEQMGMPSSSMGSMKSIADTTAAAALRAGDDYLEVVSTAGSDAAAGDPTDVGELRDSTIAAASFANGEKYVNELWPQIESGMSMSGPGAAQMFDQFRTQTGLSLPDDLATLLGDRVTFAIDSEGLDEYPGGGGSLADLNLGLKLTNDPDELKPVVDKLTAFLTQVGGPTVSGALATEETEDGMVIASNDDYASALTEDGGGLGDTERFQNAVPEGDNASNVIYVDLQQLSDLGLMGDDAEMLDPVQAFGLSTSEEDGRSNSTIRLTFD